MYNIRFNDICCLDVGALVKVRPDIPVAEPVFEPIEIPGRDGVLMPDKVQLAPINIEVYFNFMSPDADSWADSFRRARKWLKGGGVLRLSDDSDYFYKVYNVSILEAARTSLRIGEFTANFYCDPYQYLNSGENEYDPAECVYNPFDVAHPVYHVTASGAFTLTVNNNSVTGTGDTFIDTDLMIGYNDNNEIVNTTTVGDFAGLYLMEGENSFSVSGGTLKIKPRWRVE